MTAHTHPATRSSHGFGVALTVAIVGLALTTGYIHLGLGGVLFTLNALGYAGLAALYVIGSVAPVALVARFSWFPRVALAGYAALTIVAWAIQGPYFGLAYFAKAVEVGLIGLIVIDTFRVYGSPMAMARSAITSVTELFGGRSGSGMAAA
ncbi:MAG TPA: hypothetical protein VH987_04225 [Candidatus Limnocylindria bacterium]|jgi:hypothetical protein